MLWGDKPYRSLDYELKRQFGKKVYKLALDGGMTCPNRDGTVGQGLYSYFEEEDSVTKGNLLIYLQEQIGRVRGVRGSQRTGSGCMAAD